MPIADYAFRLRLAGDKGLNSLAGSDRARGESIDLRSSEN